MADYGSNERRHDATARSEADTRERLVRVETTLSTATAEITRVRDKVHEVAGHQGALVLLAEEAKADRDKLGGKLDKLGDKLDPLAIGQARLATEFAAHVTVCSAQKTEFAMSIDALKRTVWKAAGGLTALWAVVTVALAVWNSTH